VAQSGDNVPNARSYNSTPPYVFMELCFIRNCNRPKGESPYVELRTRTILSLPGRIIWPIPCLQNVWSTRPQISYICNVLLVIHVRELFYK
jgi:hypothetical protein